MANQDVSPERMRASLKLREAEQRVAKHFPEAIELAREALEVDPTFVEARHWIAERYEKAGEPRKAAVEYQEILHADHEDRVAWERLRELDPAAADRLERLHHIAPDPFVMQRASDLSDDLEDLSGFNAGVEEEEEAFFPSHEPGAETVDSLEDIAGTDAVGGGMVGTEELTSRHDGVVEEMGADLAEEEWSLEPQEPAEPRGETEPVTTAEAGQEWSLEPAAFEETEQPTAGVEAPVAAAPDPAVWLYDDDRQYHDQLAQEEFVAGLLPHVVEFWTQNDTWDENISGLAHLDHRRHEAVYSAFLAATDRFGLEPWTLFFSPERRMVPTILRGGPHVATVTTGLMNTLSPAEMKFVAGRLTGHLVAGQVPLLQVVTLIMDRTPRSITDVETDLMELLRHEHSGVLGLHRDEKARLGAMCHTWQMRAELSADRVGLLICGDLEAACNAIAKGVCLDSNAAQMTTYRDLKEKFKGQDLGQLALFPPKEDPIRNEGYGYYRARMLRWWAGTEAGQRFLGLV